MNYAPRLIEGAKRALLSSACSVHNRIPHHPRMSRAEAEELLNVCKLGQTEIGSYVIKVICPLDQMNDPPLTREHLPFAREATSLLMRAANKLLTSIESDTVENMIEEERARPVISSNLCDAFLQMHAAHENSQLSLVATWAPATKCEIPDVPTSVTFKPEYFRQIEDISRSLKPKDKKDSDTFVGTVETLNGNVGDDGRRSGDVTFVILRSDGESIKAKANLNAEDYEIAVHAHEKGEAFISFNANLLRRMNSTPRLDNITGFHSLEARKNPR